MLTTAPVGPPLRAAITTGYLVRGHLLFGLVLLLWLISIGGVWLFTGLWVWAAGLLYVAYDTALIAYVTWQVRRHVTQPNVVDHTNTLASCITGTAPRVAVIVAARNEALALPATLDALLTQDDQADEILLVDDGSSDGTLKLLRERYGVQFDARGVHGQSCLHPNLQILSKANSGKADSLNQAWRITRAEVVVTLDADTVLEPHAIAAMRAAFAREPELVAACGRLTPRCVHTLSGYLFEWFQSFEYLRAFLSRIAWMRSDALLLVSGAFAGYRRVMLEQVNGFDARCLVEDYELIHRLHHYAGVHGEHWRVRVLADAAATTDAPASLAAFLRQRRRWFAGFLQTQYKYRDMTGNPLYGNVGRFMLPVKVIDTLQPIYGLTAFALLVNFALRDYSLLQPVLAVIAGKIVIDFCFQLWAVRLYYRWIGQRPATHRWVLAVLASVIEPFCFQLLRHTGALLGWFAILTRRLDWLPQRPAALSTLSRQEQIR